jgi:hypothetical protein
VVSAQSPAAAASFPPECPCILNAVPAWGDVVMAAGRLLIMALLILAPGHAAAQTLPWSVDPPRSAPAPWPESAPAALFQPMTGFPRAAPRDGGGDRPCLPEFTRLREEVEKRGKAAKAASERKVGREEMCKYVTAFAEAEATWVDFTETNTGTSCGIPVQIANQLKQLLANTEQTKQSVCAAGPAGVPPMLRRNYMDDLPRRDHPAGWQIIDLPDRDRGGWGTLR